MTRILPTLLLFGATACAGDDAEPSATADTGDAAHDETADTGNDTRSPGFDVRATVVDLATLAPSASFEGLCADLVDSSAALGGSQAAVLAQTTVGVNGMVEWAKVTIGGTVPLLMSIRDCASANTTVFTSATAIPAEQTEQLGDGDVLDGQRAFVITMETLSRFQTSAQLAGYTGDDLVQTGVLFGFVLESGTTPTPIAGATVACSATGCEPNNVFYLDPSPATPRQESTDAGVFSSGTPSGENLVKNNETDALAGAGFLIPKAPVSQYTADDGGVHAFSALTLGAEPSGGSAVIGAIYGIPATR